MVSVFSVESYIPKKDILDVRILLTINIVASVLLFAASGVVTSAVFIVAFSVMLLFKMQKTAGKYTVAFAVCMAVMTIVMLLPDGFTLKSVLAIFGFLNFMVAKGIPLFMIAHVIIKKVNSGVLVCALRKMGIHKGFVLAITVGLRFLPTARHEMGIIKDCMKMRGIELSLKSFLKNPALIIEYSLVPLLFRSVKISEEMTVAALVKGVEYSGKKNSLIDVSLSAFDLFFLCAAFCFMGAAFIYSSYIGSALLQAVQVFARMFSKGTV